MKELVIISGKGGTGKTSVVSSFASLAKNAVFADCDVDAADLHLILEPEIKKRELFTGGKIAHIDSDKCTSCGICRDLCRFDAISEDFVVDEISCEGCGLCVWNCPVDAIAFEPTISGEWFISETRYGPMVHAKLGIANENSGKLVTLVRKEAKEIATKENLDLILVDGPPGIGCPVIASIGSADMLLVVAEPSLSAIHDMKQVLDLARHFKVPATACVNKYDINPELTASIESYCKEQSIPFLGKIPYDLQVTQAQMAGKSTVEFADGKLKESLSSLWERVLETLTGGNQS